MQLTGLRGRRPGLGLAATLLVAVTTTAGATRAQAAEAQAAQRVTYFREPSNRNDGIQVIHPQTDLGVTLGRSFGLAAGYSLDVVSGATPRVFGTTSGPVDAVSQATKFEDMRHQASGAITYSRPVADVTVGYSYGWESDYKSSTVNVSTRSDLFERTLTLGLAYSHNFDDVCDQDNAQAAGTPLMRRALVSSADCFKGVPGTVTHRLHIDTFEPSLTWIVTPRLLLQVGGTAQILDGFQANPYRRVALPAGHTPQESLPELRQRFALFTRAALALPAWRASLILMGRAYRDSWAVQAATAEATFNTYIMRSVLATLRGRVHAQHGAIFYLDAQEYRSRGPVGQYWTGDRELSPMQNTLLGVKVAYLRIPEQKADAFFDEIELAARWDGLFYRLASDYAPNADRKLALIWQFAVTARF